MQLYPTRTAAHLAIAGVAVVGVGVAARAPAIVGWGGAMLLAMAIARMVTLVSVARIRAAGFEMLWSGSRRVQRTTRGSVVEIEAEVRNRDTLAARYVKLRAVASSQVEVQIEPPAGEVAASGRLKVKVKVRVPRVGQHGVHGLALEVHGASGLFEVPLTFANPYGIEVLPRPFAAYLMQPRGGRSHLVAAAGKPGRQRGEGSDLRELREHQAGDPFRRIAWKASARRGQLLVREFEREERDVVWVVLEASLDMWAGPLGRAPLDLAIDEAAAVATRHLARGDRVGLFVYAPGLKAVIPPDQGPAHGTKIAHALATACGTHDAHRSSLDEPDVAVRVIEHLRPLDARGLSDVRRGDLDKLASRAENMRPRAPFAAAAPFARTPRERSLRRYLAAFGIDSPPKTESDRREVEQAFVEALGHIAKVKPRPSLVHVVAPPPDDPADPRIGDAIRRLTRRGTTVTWSTPSVEPALSPPWDDPERAEPDEEPPLFAREAKSTFTEVAPIAAEAVLLRARVAQQRREAGLRRLGVRVVRVKHVAPARESELANASPA
ncbi:Hypothetical protein A7982_00564 [Minicystis rosea]|nr:Hypothetical protein A7982_00564 [Minicystis rosea]